MSKNYEVSTNNLIFTGVGSISSVILSASVSNSTVIVYDNIVGNTSSGGTILVTVKAVANTSHTSYFGSKSFKIGVYAVVTGTGAKAYIDLK